jgi:hypothetical protein
MKKYKVNLNIEEKIEAKSKKEAERIFWDRFENSVWKTEVKQIK